MSALGQMGGGQMGMSDAGLPSPPVSDPFNNMHSQFQHRPTTFTPATTSAVPEERLSIEAMDDDDSNNV